MSYALDEDDGMDDAVAGYTYAGIVLRADGEPRSAVLRVLAEIRFTGWLGPVEDGWLVAIPALGNGVVATGRRGVLDVAALLADRLGLTVMAFRVLDDEQLVLGVWAGADEIGRYVSDPTVGLPPDDDTLPDPFGTEHAERFAEVLGRPDAGEELTELLAEELTDSVIESERLATVLGMLAMPRWPVSAASLPRAVSGGPALTDLTRLRAGATGAAGVLRGWATGGVRRRLRPPPAFTGVPQDDGTNIEPWML